MLTQLLIKLIICPLIWPGLLLYIIFSIADLEGEKQSSMKLTKFHQEILLLLEEWYLRQKLSSEYRKMKSVAASQVILDPRYWGHPALSKTV